MRFSTLCMATLLAVGTAGVAQATPNLVNNGDFSQTTPTTTTPTQFGTGSNGSFTSTQLVTDWTGNDGYQIWYSSALDSYTVNANSEYTSTGNEKLYGPITAANGTQTFVGLDGDQTAGVQSSISQQLTGLVNGATYTVSFDWAAAQMQSRTGATDEQLQVSFGGTSQTTALLNNASHGFTGWRTTSFSFIANSSLADWDVLGFLSIGNPTGLPPMALLTNVSVTQNVPEPPALAMFGGGLLGLGLLTMYARRREMRRRDADENNAS